jgi:hypothetical protein
MEYLLYLIPATIMFIGGFVAGHYHRREQEEREFDVCFVPDFEDEIGGKVIDHLLYHNLILVDFAAQDRDPSQTDEFDRPVPGAYIKFSANAPAQIGQFIRDQYGMLPQELGIEFEDDDKVDNPNP